MRHIPQVILDFPLHLVLLHLLLLLLFSLSSLGQPSCYFLCLFFSLVLSLSLCLSDGLVLRLASASNPRSELL